MTDAHVGAPRESGIRTAAITRGRELNAPVYAKADVIVIGSGAGGAVVARELAKDGRSVIILEEGGHYSPEEYGAMSPSNSIRRLAREAGLSAAVQRACSTRGRRISVSHA